MLPVPLSSAPAPLLTTRSKRGSSRCLGRLDSERAARRRQRPAFRTFFNVPNSADVTHEQASVRTSPPVLFQALGEPLASLHSQIGVCTLFAPKRYCDVFSRVCVRLCVVSRNTIQRHESFLSSWLARTGCGGGGVGGAGVGAMVPRAPATTRRRGKGQGALRVHQRGGARPHHPAHGARRRGHCPLPLRAFLARREVSENRSDGRSTGHAVARFCLRRCPRAGVRLPETPNALFSEGVR